MTPIAAEWTVVVVGSWNVAILNPDWFAKKILGVEQVVMEIVLENMRPRLRFIHESINIIPRIDRVMVTARTTDEETMSLVENTILTILSELPVTPITAIGVNYGFRVDSPTKNALDIFEFSDNALLARAGLINVDSTVTRKLNYDDRILNLALSFDEGGTIVVKANYHLNCDSAEAAAEGLRGRSVDFLEHAQGLVRSIYDDDEEARHE